MSAAATIAIPVIIEAAKKYGAPLVKKLLEKHLGSAAGEIGGTIIDAIAEKAGVPVEQLPEIPEAELGAAVAAVEAETPELVAAWTEQQRLTNELLMKEMDSGPGWTWWWRPAGMYLIGFWWTLYIIVWPVLNLLLRLFGASAELQLIVDVATLLAISGGFITLYMGGHTVLKGVEKWKSRS